jgi:hypothetical protein
VRILGFHAENLKKIKVVDITPNAYVNRISGANGSGKSSALDAIEWALRGTSSVPTHPVRKGAGRGHVSLDLGEWTVTRRFTEGGSRNGVLYVEPKDGKSRLQGPQEFLDKLVGPISFDPLEFIRLKANKQAEVLRTLVTFDIDLDELQKEYDADYLKRRDLKKEVTALETRRDTIRVPQDLPTEKRDEAAMLLELTEASSYNEDLGRQRKEREDALFALEALTNAAKQKADRLLELRAELERVEVSMRQDLDKLQEDEATIKAWKPLPKPKDAEELAETLRQARIINQAIDKRDQRDELQREVDEKEAEVTKLSEALKEREAAKTKAIESAKYPVEGLAFGEEEVIYEGLPFNQISNADQIRASVAIGMASNPELRLMRIKDGSLLDEQSMAIIAEMCKQQDFQLFVEVVDTSGEVGIYLEDGEVKAVNEEPEPAAPAPKAKKPRAKKIPATA